MRSLLPFILLFAVPALAGCTAGDPCRDAVGFRPVEEIRGSDILVNDGGAIIHAANADIWLMGDDGACTAIGFDQIYVGDLVADDATQVAESYPTQQWPDNIVVQRT